MDQARKEPSLADLEAFERLLRDSLQHERAGQVPKPEAVAAPVVPPTPSPNDQAALAELSRLSSAPLSFELPDFGEALPGAHAVSMPAPAAQPAVETASQPSVQGTTNASLGPDWSAMAEVLPSFTAEAERTIYAPRRAEQAAAPAPEADPLKAFEEELRRFDAANGYSAPPPAAPDLRAEYPGNAAYQPAYAEPAQPILVPDSDPSWQAGQAYAQQAAYPEPAPNAADQSLADAEAKLAAEAAAAATANETASGGGRSKMIFYALGGIAVAGLAAIGASLALGGKKTASTTNVPVIAAKTEPAKEKPANPGGIEIPDQNKQILAAKNAPAETKPAQVVNNTEQPMDLNQVTKRESVRVIAPNPYQTPPAAPAQPDANAAPAAPPANDAKRVQSVRIGDPIMPPKAPPAAAPAPNGIPTLGTAGAAVGGAAAIAAIAAASNRPTTPSAAPAPAPAAPKAAAPAPAAATPPAPPKVETRPNAPTTTPRVAAPTPAAAPRPATTPPKAANAPLQLNPAQRAAQPAARPAQVATAPAAGGGGGFAIQLASRPTQADANAASGQLASKYSSALGGKPARVVSGEANGKTVYRVRVGGYSQAEAAAACERVKAAGGGCFVTRQ